MISNKLFNIQNKSHDHFDYGFCFIHNFGLMYKLLISMFLLFPFLTSAQDSVKVNAIYAEAGGIGAYGSIGYERLIPVSNKWSFGARVGISTLNFLDFNNKFNPDLILPITISAYYGNQHQAEFGLANTFTGINEYVNNNTKRNWSANGALIIGYRFNATRNPLFAKCFYSPMLIEYQRVNHWGGLAIGYRF